ncbi:MAG: hypothetical protein A2W03_07325 [Candidatus Aminicenantes bacterium RBG_16_63_16]|nr:MAG: hypothetical protein A2W03_07325 [Candidatus Aminicenantes bacterium RBG_16_63_16]HCS48527.1 hypothetical protein [Candidatus Aminicenantes bacterium]
MKTNLIQMSEFLHSSLAERRVEPAAGCPSPNDLVKLVIQGLSKSSRAKIMMHVSNCASCAQEVKSILRLSGEIDKLTGKVEAIQGCPQPEALGEPRHVARLLNRRAAVAALAGLAGVAFITLAVIKLADRPILRGAAGPQIRLLSPKQVVLPSVSEIRFRWKAVPKAKGYIVELFDKSLARIWRSGTIPDTGIDLPAEAQGSVHAGETYFWRVTAVFDEDSERASRLAEFSIRR